MKIDLTQEQFRQLIELSSIGSSVFGILGYSIEKNDYKKRSVEMEELETHLLQYANDFDCSDLTDKDGEEIYVKEAYYEETILPTLDDYDDLILHDNLANKLAKRDFVNTHTPDEIEKIANEHNGYLGVQLYDYEKKYWDEFENHDFERLKIDEISE
ncbi:hypothetical protein COY32_05465 [candidate division WWE3 bacterium CG_4_10_14_0_2_um_filter_41_14]|uniref:Uncharacterized protein n=1 Tax=candidate division WWE3 bacterium CG_4_10_14_0_2_um_filter_41_14 TaxID=1975072 RepID=A0A2M7THD3_UNCKA|nr:MAG: hypothetical protein COY32_05465 [candidate division WWE3 bacterium CG_4_10_14_0_2_um_filter_41_14]